MKKDKYIVLENNLIRTVFEAETGIWQNFFYKRLQWNIMDQKHKGLSFEIHLPLENDRSHYIFGEQQRLSSYKLEHCTLRLEWDQLYCDKLRKSLPIKLIAMIHLEKDQISFEFEIQNCSDYVVESIAFPCLIDINGKTSSTALDKISGKQEIIREPLYPKFSNDKGYAGVLYPTNNGSSNTTGLYNLIDAGDHGLYMGCHDPEMPYLFNWHYEARPGYEDCNQQVLPRKGSTEEETEIRFYARHFSFVQSGNKFKSMPVVIQPYIGSIYQGMDIYREWRKSWFKPLPFPSWVREPHSWLQIQLFGDEDQLNFRFSDLKEVAKQCKNYGISVIQLTGWAEGGQDRGNPSHDIEPRLGSREEFYQAIKEFQNHGIKVILFSKFTWWDSSRDDFTKNGDQYCVRDQWGRLAPAEHYRSFSPSSLNGINTPGLVPCCPASSRWRDVVYKEFKKLLDLDADGTLYDQCETHGSALYCFSSEHGHPVPKFIYHADIELAKGFHSLIDQHNHDFLIAGEHCYDSQSRWYALSYGRFFSGHIPKYRYESPYAAMMMQVTGQNDRNQLNRCLEYRYMISYEPKFFKGLPNYFPNTMQYGKLVEGLRIRYRYYLWDSAYCGASDLIIYKNEKLSKDFSLYRHPESGLRCLIICNTDREKLFEYKIELENQGNWQKISPECPDPQSIEKVEVIQPCSVLVLIEL